MAKPAKSDTETGKKVSEPARKRKGVRCTDDLELLKIILEENPRLKLRVMYIIESALGKRPTT